MCRRNQLAGCALMTFGLGVVIGAVISSGFLCCIIGLGTLVLGFCLLQKR